MSAALTNMLSEVGIRIESLEQEVDRLRKAEKKVGDQYLDALDEVYALREQLKERDEMIAELQAMVSRAHDGGA